MAKVARFTTLAYVAQNNISRMDIRELQRKLNGNNQVVRHEVDTWIDGQIRKEFIFSHFSLNLLLEKIDFIPWFAKLTYCGFFQLIRNCFVHHMEPIITTPYDKDFILSPLIAGVECEWHKDGPTRFIYLFEFVYILLECTDHPGFVTLNDSFPNDEDMTGENAENISTLIEMIDKTRESYNPHND